MLTSHKINIQVKANAKRSAIIGWHNDYLKIAIQSPAIDGKANKVLINFLSDYLAIPKSHIQITHGLSAPKKQVALLSEDDTWLTCLPQRE